jgi:hypothetical protein
LPGTSPDITRGPWLRRKKEAMTTINDLKVHAVELVRKLKDDPLVAKMKNAIRDVLDAHPELSHIEVNAHYWEDNEDRVISGEVTSTVRQRKIDEIAKARGW